MKNAKELEEIKRDILQYYLLNMKDKDRVIIIDPYSDLSPMLSRFGALLEIKSPNET